MTRAPDSPSPRASPVPNFAPTTRGRLATSLARIRPPVAALLLLTLAACAPEQAQPIAYRPDPLATCRERAERLEWNGDYRQAAAWWGEVDKGRCPQTVNY